MSLHLKINCYFYETRKLLTSIQSVLPPTVTYIHLSFQFCRPIQYSKCYSYNLKTNKPFNSKLNNTILFIILPIYYFIHVCAESSKGRYVLYIDSAKKDKFIYCVVYNYALAYKQVDLDACSKIKKKKVDLDA